MLRLFYPLIRKAGKSGKNGTILINSKNVAPKHSFYLLKAMLINGKELDFMTLSGKQVLLVNTASNCGYTGQYAELQALYEKYGDKLFILAFPANDFADQEKADNDEIAQFCQVNYGVTFPVMKKGVVIKKAEQQDIYKWLTNSNENGWNEHAPDWNFGKYLINEKGTLTHYFGPSISPLDDIFIRAIENNV